MFHKLLGSSWTTAPSADDEAAEPSPFQLELLALMGTYRDLYHPEICPLRRGPQVRRAYCLHVLNHVLKANSAVSAHSAQLKQQQSEAKVRAEPADEFRDQGLTRPKVNDGYHDDRQTHLSNHTFQHCFVFPFKIQNPS